MIEDIYDSVHLFALYDEKEDRYNPPFPASMIQALRSFEKLVRDPTYDHFYQEIELHVIGMFDLKTGDFIPQITKVTDGETIRATPIITKEQ